MTLGELVAQLGGKLVQGSPELFLPVSRIVTRPRGGTWCLPKMRRRLQRRLAGRRAPWC